MNNTFKMTMEKVIGVTKEITEYYFSSFQEAIECAESIILSNTDNTAKYTYNIIQNINTK